MTFDSRERARARLAGMAHPLALMLALGWVAPQASAQPMVAPPFATLFQQAQAMAPRLAESQAGIRAAEGLALQAGLRPNPSAGLEFENIGIKEKDTGFAEFQATLSIGQPIELGGKRGARAAAGQAGVQAATARNRQTVVDYGYELAIAYAAAEAAQARVALLEEAVAAAQDDVRAARALVDAGREADLRGVQAEAAATTAQADLEGARADAQAAYAALSSLAGVTMPYTGVVASLLPLSANPLATPGEPPVSSPAVVAAEAEREAALRRIDVERTRGVPDITPSVGVRRIN